MMFYLLFWLDALESPILHYDNLPAGRQYVKFSINKHFQHNMIRLSAIILSCW